MSKGSEKTMVLIRLYEGAIRFLCEGVDALDAGAPDVFAERLSRAQDVLDELDALVDPLEVPVAADMHGLYAFMAGHLHRASDEQDASAVREVAGLLEELNQGFRFVAGGGSAPGAM